MRSPPQQSNPKQKTFQTRDAVHTRSAVSHNIFQHAKIEQADSHPDRIRDSSFDLLPQKSVEPILRAATYPDSRHRRVATYWEMEMEILTVRLNEATDNEDDTVTILVPAGVTGPFVC
jgi:hypothetical protein